MDSDGPDVSYGVDLPADVLAGDVRYDEKYLLIHIVEKNKWLVVSRRLRYHSRIYDAWREEQVASRTYNEYGGGILEIDGAGGVRTFGSSGGFGPVQELDRVRRCLETTTLRIKTVEATD